MAGSTCLVKVFPSTISLNYRKFISFTLSQRRGTFISISASTSPSATTISLLKSKHLPPDFTQKQLLDTLRQESDETSALNLFEWALEQPEFEPSRQVCEEILRKLGKAGSFDAMRRVLDDMKESRVEIGEGTFFIFIERYAMFELYDEAIGVLDVMEHEFAVEPGTFSYNLLLNVLVDGNKLKLVKDVLSRMLSEGLNPDVSTYNILIKALCKEGWIEEALSFVQEMSSQGFCFNHFTYNTLISGLCKAGHVCYALDVLDLLLQEGFNPDLVTYNTVISGLCEAGEVKEAIEILTEMILMGCLPDNVTYNTIISTLCKENQVPQAIELSCILTSIGILPNVFIFNSLINGLCLSSNFNCAMELFQEMKTVGCQPDEFTYNILIGYLCAHKKLDEAMTLLQDMESSGYAESLITYNILIDGFCKNKRIEEARKIFDEMVLQGISRDLVTYNTLIDGLCKAKRVEEAAQLMDKMITEGLKPDTFTYNSILYPYCRAGDVKKAADIMQIMTSNWCEPDVFTYGTLIQGICKSGSVEVATRLLITIQMKGMVLAPQAYNPIIMALFRQKRTKEALRLFREMEIKADPPDYVSHKIVFQGLCSGGGPIDEAVNFAFEMMEKGYVPELSSFSMMAEKLFTLAREETLVMLIDMIMNKADISDNQGIIKDFLKTRNFQDALTTLGHALNSRYPQGNLVKGGMRVVDANRIEICQQGGEKRIYL